MCYPTPMRDVIRHQVRLCTNPTCGLRFPVMERDTRGYLCPRCGSPTDTAVGLYEEHKAPRPVSCGGTPRMEVLLDNIRSIYNVGSIFRTSDGAGVSHIHLCGITPTPDNPRLKKTALGADEAVPWSYHQDGHRAAGELIAQGKRLWALEGGVRSTPIAQVTPGEDGRPVVLVIGNEICGVDPGILSICEQVLGIPMQGVKTSLNTAVAFGIAVYTLRSS
ncbi:MAG TPA: RNA methyltransferase [Deltaproteobacteria bacterium]|nr:RNA methyltransferase [Deltaproteobacteria bacterium]